MRSPSATYEYMIQARSALMSAATRAPGKLGSGSELSDEELLGVTMVAHPELLRVRQVGEKVEIHTSTPVEAVLSNGSVELRRTA